MADKPSVSIPKTAEHAKAQGFKPAPHIVHATLPVAEKRNFALVKPGSPHIICYWDDNTGGSTDCHTSDSA